MKPIFHLKLAGSEMSEQSGELIEEKAKDESK